MIPELAPGAAEAMIVHFREEMPYEGCGLIMPDGSFVPAPNAASDPRFGFAIPPGMAEDLGAVAIVHSHPSGMRCPSTMDMTQQAVGALPWGIMWLNAQHAEPLFWLTGKPLDPTGQGWRCGITDCLNLVRWEYLQRGIELPDVPRGPDTTQWAAANRVMMAAWSMGFARVAEPEPGDVCLLRLTLADAAHLAVVMPSGDLWHHPGPMHGDYDASSLPRLTSLGWAIDQDRIVGGFWRFVGIGAATAAA